MADDETERLLEEIGLLLAEDTKYPLDGTLLHAVAAAQMVGPSIFKDRGNHVLHRWPDLDRLGGAILDLWDAQEGDDRWAEMEYLIRNGRFEVTYTYPEDIDPEEDELERRSRVVARHFGDKPIIYAPWPPDDGLPDYDL